MSNTSAGRSKWPYVPLTTVAEKIQDGTHFSPLSTSGPFRYVTSRNIRPGYLDLESCGWISEREHKAIFRRCDPRYGDILLTKDGANTGNASINTLHEEISLLSSVAMIRTDPTVADGHFVLQYLLSPEGQTRLTDLVSGNAITRLTLAKIKAFSIPSAPLPEQRAIAAVLDSLDDAIQKTEQIIAKLQQVKQGLLHDLLTRGIDDNGELRDPERHPEQFQDSPLGRIPKGWRAESLGSLVTSAVDGPFGSALKSEHYVPQPGVRLVRLQNIGSGEFIDHDHAWISQRYAETLRRHDAVSGDVLVASLGDENHPYGRACVFQDGSWAIVKADCFRLRPTGFMNSDFLAASLNIDVYHRPLRGLAQGVTRDRVNLGNLLRVRLPVPSREEQNSIINMVDSLQRRITCEQNRAQKLRSTKAGLSEDLLTGRVRTTSLPGFSA